MKCHISSQIFFPDYKKKSIFFLNSNQLQLEKDSLCVEHNELGLFLINSYKNNKFLLFLFFFFEIEIFMNIQKSKN